MTDALALFERGPRGYARPQPGTGPVRRPQPAKRPQPHRHVSDRPLPGPILTPPALRESLGSRVRWAVPWLGMLLIAAALAPVRQVWCVQAPIVVWLLFAPGRLMLTALRVKPIQVRRFPTYTVAMSLLMVMLTGAAVDGVGVVAGAARPLSTGPLWAGTAVAYLVLVTLAAAAPRRVRPDITRLPSPVPYGMLVLPLLAAAGALRLNSGSGPVVALIAMVALIAVWFVRPLLPGFTWRTASFTVYAVSLAGMWSFSLRGDSVYGYDIITEHFIAQHTSSLGVWHLSHVNDAYGALLSVAVLPATLHSVAGISILAVFKVLFPAVFAFVPVGILRLGGRLVRLPWAYASVGVVIGQTFFFDSMPAVARQEIAFVFFVCLLSAITNTPGRLQNVIVGLAAVGMVTSHYSSTYMAAALTAAATVLALAGRLVRRRPPVAAAAVAAVVLLLGSYIWYNLLTRSASNVGGVASAVRENGLDLLPNRGSNIVSTFINGTVVQPLSPLQYTIEVARRYAQQYPFVHPWPQASAYPLQNVPASHAGDAFVPLTNLALATVNQTINLLAICGAIGLLAARRRTAMTRAFGLLSVGVLSFLVLIRLSGTVAIEYSQQRAQIQAFMLLAPAALWFLSWCRSDARSYIPFLRVKSSPVRRSIIWGVSMVCATMMLTNAVGLLREHPSVNGAANVSATGENEARFVLHQNDLDAARWLLDSNVRNQQMYADNYGQLRLLAERGNLTNVLRDITPRTLGRGSWIYAYSANVRDKTTRSSFDLNSITYRFPTAFLNRFYDLVYTNGTARVYH